MSSHTSHTWTLMDAPHDCEAAATEIGPKDLSGTPGNWHVSRRRMTGGLSDGVDLIELENGRTSYTILATRGMGLWKARTGQTTLGWKSPIRGPVHPKFVPLDDPSGLGWLDGFDELMVRCGLESNGAPDFEKSGRLHCPLHGRIANRPAARVEVTVDNGDRSISLRGVVEESRFHFQKLRLTTEYKTWFDSATIQWCDKVHNIGGMAAELQMLYHVNIGEPLLDAGSRVVAPVAQVCPRDAVAVQAGPADWSIIPPPEPGSAEQVYFLELLEDADGETPVLLHNAQASAGVRLQFRREALPWFSLWRNTPAAVDGYVVGLEPATNFPNPKSFERNHGRLVLLGPGECWEATTTLEWIQDPAAVEQAAREISHLQDGVRPVIHEQPLTDWSLTE